MTEPTLINSVVRALTLLEAVADEGSPVLAKRLARLTGFPLPTTYHLLRTLVHQGYLHRTDRDYVVGDVPGHLAQASRATTPSQRVRRVLRTLHREVGAAAYLALLVDGEVELVDIVDSPASPRTDLWVGLHDSAHATALGKAIIGALPEEERRAYLRAHPLVDLTPHTLTSMRTLLAELDEQRGVVVDDQEYAIGTTCVAVRLPAGHVTGAVAVSVPVEHADAVLARAHSLRRAAHLIGLALATEQSDGSAITI